MNMKDIAKICGVSRQTVHAALNNKPGVSPETREHILRVVREHNYHPNRIATSLHQKSADFVGLTILDIRNPFFADLVQGITQVVKASGLHLMFFETVTKEDEIDAVETMISYRAAGMILAPVQDESRTRHLEAIKGRGIPLVSVGEVRGFETNYVEVDNRRASQQAVQHLIDKGHRRIVYFAGPDRIVSARERTVGFMESMMENRLSFSPGDIMTVGDSTQGGYKAANQVLSRPESERPTAIVCFNDMVALGVYEAAVELGVSIPEDISVIGCDDIHLARLLGPPLTTIALPVREMGQYAAQMLVDQIHGPDRNGSSVVKKFHANLVVRHSVKNLCGLAS